MSSEAQSAEAARPVSFERERGVYDLRVARDLAHVVVELGDADTVRVQRILHSLASESIPIFLFKLHTSAVSFAVESDRVPHVESCMAPVAESCRTRGDLALISVVASSMRDLTGVMVSIADALQQAGARLYGVGDSHSSVQCLIDGARVPSALSQLRATFGLRGEGGHHA